jgi:rubrerythrin
VYLAGIGKGAQGLLFQVKTGEYSPFRGVVYMKTPKKEETMVVLYECQICGNIVEGRPGEWCSECGGHRAIFKRITPKDYQLSLAS